MLNLTVKIDSSNLNTGLEIASRYTKKTTAEVVNTSALFVAMNARKNMPFVTPERVDTELSVIAHPVIGKRGNVLKNRKTYTAAKQLGGGAPLAALIVQARASQTSKYNKLTNFRYAISASPFKGKSREAGRAAMAALVDKMIKARHKSGKFLAAGWIPVIGIMRKFARSNLMQTSAPIGGLESGRLGAAAPAREGFTCTAQIENDVGMEGVNRASFNRALLTYGGPGLQSAVDKVADQEMKYALRKMEEGLVNAVNPKWK